MDLTRRAAILGLASASLSATVASANELRHDSGSAFGSSWRVSVDRSVDLTVVRPAVEAIIRQVDAQMSPYRNRSELTIFNESSKLEAQVMPPELCSVAAEALRIARLTDGAFDPTVGPVVSRFGFGPIQGGTGAFSQIEVTSDTLRKAIPDLTLDLCGIAKGYALDRIAEALERSGVRDAMIEVGGEIRVLGRHPKGRQWIAAISDPSVLGFQAYRLVAPGAQALATSGHAVNGVAAPISVSHIINPILQRPADTDLASVSVLAPTAMEADALATALCAAGSHKGISLAQRLDISALFILRRRGETSDHMTGRFGEHVLV